MALAATNHSSPYIEKTLDFIPHVTLFLERGVLSPFAIVKIPHQLLCVLAPVNASWHRDGGIKPRQLTVQAIENNFFDPIKTPDAKDISKEKLLRVLEKVKEIAKALHINQEIQIYSSEAIQPTTALGTRCSQTAIPIFINLATLKLSDEEIEFALAHELSHIAHNDYLHLLVLSTVILAIEVIAAIIFTPFLIPLIASIESIFEKYLLIRNEKAADLSAMTILKSNCGAVKLFDGLIAEHLKFRKNDEEHFIHNREKYFNSKSCFLNVLRRCFSWISKDTLVSKVNVEGENRFDVHHPTLAQRKQDALNFVP